MRSRYKDALQRSGAAAGPSHERDQVDSPALPATVSGLQVADEVCEDHVSRTNLCVYAPDSCAYGIAQQQHDIVPGLISCIEHVFRIIQMIQ